MLLRRAKDNFQNQLQSSQHQSQLSEIQKTIENQYKIIEMLANKVSEQEAHEIVETAVETQILPPTAVQTKAMGGRNIVEQLQANPVEILHQNTEAESKNQDQNLLEVNQQDEIIEIAGDQNLTPEDKELIKSNLEEAEEAIQRSATIQQEEEQEMITDQRDRLAQQQEMDYLNSFKHVDVVPQFEAGNDLGLDREPETVTENARPDFTPYDRNTWEGKIYDYDITEAITCRVKMAPAGTYTPIPLLSFPGCGNTWVRYLIEQATGIYSGSVYHDGGLYNHGHYLGEMEDPTNGTTIVQKVHRVKSNAYSNQLFRQSDYCIFLLRDPRKAFMSEFTRLQSHSHMGVVTSSIFSGQIWEDKAKMWATVGFPDCYGYPRDRGFCQKEIFYLFYEDLRKVDLDEDLKWKKFNTKSWKIRHFKPKRKSSSYLCLFFS